MLHRCDGDGRNIRAISDNREQDNTPWMLPDGRILYTRWEYVDRSQVEFHHLWTMNPDGTGQSIFFGNMHPGIVMLDAKPIPGTQQGDRQFLARPRRNGPHGHRHDRRPGRRARTTRLSARAMHKPPLIEDPYALSEDCFFAARGKQIMLFDGFGNAASSLHLDGRRRLSASRGR